MVYKFEQIAYNITAKRSPNKDDMSSYIGLEHLESGSLDVTSFGSKVEIKGDKLIMTKGDVLLGKRNAYLRRAAIAPHDGLFSAHGMILRPKEDVIDPKYFPFFIASDIFFDEAIRISVGGLSPTINWKDLKELEFTLPSLSEQKVLADKLWAAYRVKESYKKLLAATDDMLKAKFQEMFGDLDKNRIVKDVANVVSGKSIPTKYEDIVGNIAYVKVADFNIPGNEKYITTSSRFVTLESASLSKYVSSGSVLFAKNGAAALSNKKRLTIIDCCIDMNTMAIIPMKDKICPEYLLSIFENTNIEDYVRQGAIPSISPKDIENMAIYLPPLPLQQQFVEIATQAEATKESLRKSIENIDQVIKSLINQ
jgi:type I restriction enzyme S subunit